MTRTSAELVAIRKRLTIIVLMIAGVIGVVIGVAIAGVELYHFARGAHAFERAPFFYAGVFILSGVLLIQTGNVRDALDIVKSAVPFFREAKAGGDRKTDPPDPAAGP